MSTEPKTKCINIKFEIVDCNDTADVHELLCTALLELDDDSLNILCNNLVDIDIITK